MILSMAEKANTFSAGGNRTYSDGRNRENKCGSGKRIGTRGSSKKRPLHDGSGQGEKLLYLWRIWAHGLLLQKSRKRKGSRWKKTGIWRRKN